MLADMDTTTTLVPNPIVPERVDVALAVAGKSLCSLVWATEVSDSSLRRFLFAGPRHADRVPAAFLEKARKALGEPAYRLMTGETDTVKLPPVKR